VTDLIQNASSVASFISLTKQVSTKLKKNEFASGAISSATSTSTSSTTAAEGVLLRALSAGCASALSELERTSPRVYEKIKFSSAMQLGVTGAAVYSLNNAAATAAASGALSPRSSHSAAAYETSLAATAIPAPPNDLSANGQGASSSSSGSLRNGRRLSTGRVPLSVSTGASSSGAAAGVVLTSSSEKIGSRFDAQSEAGCVGIASSPRGSSGAGGGEDCGGSNVSSSPRGSRHSVLDSNSDAKENAPAVRTEVDSATYTSSSSSSSSSKRQVVSDLWFEAKLMLRIVPSTESGWNQLSRGAKNAPLFISQLTAAANKCNLPRGTLLRTILPFDESTSSNDQSKVVPPPSPSCSSSTSSGTKGLDSNMASSLREQAIELRRLIRVKMADEADLQQAITVCDQLRAFVTKVENLSQETSQSPTSIIRTLVDEER